MVGEFMKNSKRNRRRRGSALLEITLLSPWIFFLFIFVIDMGFFCYSLIAVENAARTGAEYTSKSPLLAGSSQTACDAAKLELSMLPNITFTSTCNASPLVVTAVPVLVGLDGSTGTPATSPSETSVSVTY